MQHTEPHPLSGQTVKIASGEFAGRDYRLEDWWDRLAGKSWMDCDGNRACLEYALRSAGGNNPFSNEVVYGKIDGAGKLMHVSDLSIPEASE